MVTFRGLNAPRQNGFYTVSAGIGSRYFVIGRALFVASGVSPIRLKHGMRMNQRPVFGDEITEPTDVGCFVRCVAASVSSIHIFRGQEGGGSARKRLCGLMPAARNRPVASGVSRIILEKEKDGADSPFFARSATSRRASSCYGWCEGADLEPAHAGCHGPIVVSGIRGARGCVEFPEQRPEILLPWRQRRIAGNDGATKRPNFFFPDKPGADGMNDPLSPQRGEGQGEGWAGN